MTHASDRSVDRGGRGHTFVFVLEQVLGHCVHGRNIQRALEGEPDISPTVIPIGQRGAGLASRLPLLGSWSFEASMATRTALRRRLSAGHADAVFIHTQVATLLAGNLMRRVPTVISMDATPLNFDSLGAGYGHGRQPEAVERWKHRVNRRAFSASKAIVTFSRWAADSVVDDYGIPAAKVHVIRPGVDLRHFRPRPVERPPGPVRILFVGGDFVRKGGDDLLETVRYLGDSAELDLVTASAPPSLPGSPRIRVHVGLDHNSEQLFDLYRRADVFVLPSRGECYGHVICEALASGLPVVACDVGAVSELVVDGCNGLLVPPGSPARLAEAIRMLVEQPELRRILGERGLRMAERDHDAARNAGTIFDLMRTLSERRLARPGAAGEDHAEMEV